MRVDCLFLLHLLLLFQLFDMVNHESGPISTWFDEADGPGTPTVLGLNALRDFSPGEQLFMSYGSRPPLQLVMYMGFVNDRDPATNEAHLSVLFDAMPPPSEDRLARLRVTILNGLKITPAHHAGRAIRSNPALVERLRRQQDGLLSKDESEALDRVLWALPLTFLIKGDGAPSHDLLSFLRVRAISSKPDAAEALKQSDQSRKRAEQALSEFRAAQEAAAAAGGGGAPDAPATFQLPPLQVDVLSAENEAAALGALRTFVVAAADAMEPAAVSKSATAALDPADPVLLYRANQARLFRLCGAWADSRLAEFSRAAPSSPGAALA